MNNQISFSVIICCYNSELYLEETIKSIISQSYKNWEIIAINDGSTDKTESIIMKYLSKEYPITYFKQENKGFASARNKAIELSRYDWIVIIDHDDICLNNRLETHCNQIQSNPDIKFFFADTIHFDNDGNELKRHFENHNLDKIDPSKGNIIKYILEFPNLIDTESVVFDKKAAISVGLFDTSFMYLVDYDFFLRMGSSFSMSFSKKIVSKWRVHSNQTTKIVGESLRIKEGNRIIFRYLKMGKTPLKIKLKLIFKFFYRYFAMYLRPIFSSFK
jgi:glycosyltransferase involved in cell wall biosynthesis